MKKYKITFIAVIITLFAFTSLNAQINTESIEYLNKKYNSPEPTEETTETLTIFYSITDCDEHSIVKIHCHGLELEFKVNSMESNYKSFASAISQQNIELDRLKNQLLSLNKNDDEINLNVPSLDGDLREEEYYSHQEFHSWLKTNGFINSNQLDNPFMDYEDNHLSLFTL